MKLLWIVPVVCIILPAVLWVRSMMDMPLQSHEGPLPPLSAMEEEIAGGLRTHVVRLAGEIGERNIWHYDSLRAAASYIDGALRESGYRVRRQEYKSEGKIVANLEAGIEGFSRPERIVVVGAHYDSVRGSPGANDNASGVAALLEIARLLSGRGGSVSLRLVAFVNEEPPFFQTEGMGSLFYARAARKRGENIIAALSLETIGFYSDEPGSQHYPPPFGLAYPDRGNFIGFVGNTASAELVRRCVGSFRRHTSFPSEGIAAPGAVPGVGWSDHWAFWQEGYPGVMITDTAPFRYEHYHAVTDRPDQIDYGRTARVVAGLYRVIAELAGVNDEGAGQ